MNKNIFLLLVTAILVSCFGLNSFAGLHLGLPSAIKDGVRELKIEKENKDATNHVPGITSLTANPASITINSATTVTCTAFDPDNDPLTYIWSAATGTFSGSGSQITWTAPATIGSHTISCTVADNREGTARQSVTITVAATVAAQAWTKLLGTSQDDEGCDVTADSAGNIYFTGYTKSGLEGNTPQALQDVFISKYDATGSSLWTKQFGSSYNEKGLGVAVDQSNNVFITGYTYGNIDNVIDDPAGSFNQGASDIFLVKYDSNGTKVWSAQFGTNSYDESNGVVTDSSGDIYITGFTERALDGNIAAGEYDIFITKYNTSCNRVWTKQFGTTATDKAYGIAIDSSDNIYITGETWGDLDGNSNRGNSDIFLAKYTFNGTRVWTRQLGSSAADVGVGVATDASGNVYITGKTYYDLDDNTSQGEVDTFLAKYDSNGTKLWVEQLGSSASDESLGVATDAAGNAYITGWTVGNLDNNTNQGASDIFLTKYNSTGTKLWTKQLGTTGSESSSGIITDSAGNIYISGWTDNNLDDLTNKGAKDIFLIKFTP